MFLFFTFLQLEKSRVTLKQIKCHGLSEHSVVKKSPERDGFHSLRRQRYQCDALSRKLRPSLTIALAYTKSTSGGGDRSRGPPSHNDSLRTDQIQQQSQLTRVFKQKNPIQ